ncbi:SO_0444 family Cu/Zn efflux transporter [Celerinatantimonas yamalensis]|uniref:SO_0444 family Cu/Zn efflux transporter n=1 Tax=Celerinatantimonas yamalensis TaxID=559956 RepID=A0ABW9G451_9GAMM
MQTLYSIGQAFVNLWLDAAAWLVLGLIVAGLLQTLLHSDKLAQHLRGDGLWPAIKAALLGMPLPLCSCGVIPAAIGLRRAGASKSATTAFLISTPETGVDSIAISYALLGPFMAIIRPIAAVCSAIVSAALVLLESNHSQATTPTKTPCHAQSSCCCHDHGTESATSTNQGLIKRLWQGQRYAFSELLEDLSVWLLVGLLISAIVVTKVPYDALADISRGPWAMIIMALIGVPMYICASASTPLAAGLMLAGVSPGAILVFLLAGPATNVATLGMVHKEMGWQTLISYLVGVIGVAIGFGYLTNWLVDLWQINIQNELSSSHNLMPSWLAATAAIFLAIVVLVDLCRKVRSLLSAHHRHSHDGHHH